MLKRIFTISLITGVGQLFVIFALKYISQNSSPEQVKAIGQIDSLILFIMNVIAMGLQSVAIRNLAMTSNWQKEYRQTQSARTAMGLLLMIAAVLVFINPYYIIFLAAPIFAWSGDYALYARGYPIVASIVALIRLFIPFTCLIVAAYYRSEWLALVYITSFLVVYALSNLAISATLKTPYFIRPDLKSLRLYIDSIYIGVVVLSLYFIGLGLILVLPYFYNDPVVAIAFLGLKVYVIFKGILRLIHQAFIKEMINDEVCLKVDQIAGLTGMSFLVFLSCFPDTFIGLFFGEKLIQYKIYFILIAIAAFIYSLFSSLIIKALLEKKDKPYAWISFLAAFFTVTVSIFFSFFKETVNYVGISLVLGELFFASAMLILMYRSKLVSDRLIFIGKNIFYFLIPIVTNLLFGDDLIPFILSFVVLLSIMIVSYHNKFQLSQIN